MLDNSWPTSILQPGEKFIDTSQPDTHLNACIGRQLPGESGDQYYSDGFRSAASSLVNRLVEGNRVDLPVDLVVYPVVFLYRHHLELLLKLLIRASRWSRGEGAEWPTGHSLKQLWCTARDLVEACFEDAEWSQNPIATSLFEELDNLDPNGEAARYLKNQRGEQHFADLWILNVRHFADIAERLSDYLSELLGRIEYEQEQRVAWEYEMLWPSP